MVGGRVGGSTGRIVGLSIVVVALVSGGGGFFVRCRCWCRCGRVLY